ncbi:alpha/beta fold hydrolase [Sinosporangium siamense]|uniref:Transporter n=1 Tax=Sinosporangium siamense TaxID=1367973 RepID=A0A919RMC2_9ACTN|nr:alpha/beta fold hydrolase [Sinosporangium siamense]GII95480.1 transporter [Sinosporangium siamense]
MRCVRSLTEPAGRRAPRRRTHRIFLRAAASATAVTGALTLSAGHGATGTVDAGSPKPSPCGSSQCQTLDGHRVEYGTISRPLLKDQPKLGTTPVGYARVLRTRLDRPAAGTLMVNPGGPGAPAISEAKGYIAQFKDLLTDYDLLLIDPRGTGRSGEVSCHVKRSEIAHSGRLGFQEKVARCAAELGPRAAAYTSAATADDFDAVRAHLGIDKLVLFGTSYGTYLMPIYAQRHPSRVKSIVLSGAYPLNTDPLGRDSAQAVSLDLQRICARSGECDGNQAVRDLTTFAAQLREKPLKISLKVGDKTRNVTFDESMLASLLFTGASSGVGSKPDEPSMLGGLPSVLAAAVKGDYKGLRSMLEQTASGRAAHDDFQSMAVVCNDYPRPFSVDASIPQRREQFADALARTRPGDFGAFSARGFTGGLDDLADACITWPRVNTARPYVSTGRFPDVPVLVLSGDLDANTTVLAGRRAAAQFKNVTFLVVPNMGHTPDADPGGCVTGIIVKFIRTGDVGRATCLSDLPAIKVKPPG